MSVNRWIAVLLLCAVAMTAGCRTREDVYARYVMERKLWKAQVQERKINIGFVKASQRDILQAIEEFNKVVDYEPLARYDTSDWSPQVVADIRRLRIVSRIALANLYFLSEQYRAAGDSYARTLNDTELDFARQLDVRLNLARTLYLAGESDLLESNCAEIFKEITESKEFWAGGFQLKEVFLSIPLVLARLYRERGDTKRYEEFSQLAESFYDKVASTWPDDVVAARAVYSRVSLYLMQERWHDALADIEWLMTNDRFEERSGNLWLLKGEILAYALNDRPAATKVFEELIRNRAGSQVAFAARFDLAALELDSGRVENSLQMMRELEVAKGVPAEIAAKAVLTRALQLERQKRWDEALPLLGRVMRLYPETMSAVEAPLVVTRHYVAAGEMQLAERSLRRATDFYVALLTRQSKYRGDRLMVQDFLIENYLAMGRADEVASMLENRAMDWDEASMVGGMFKSAILYSAVLDDSESAKRVLRKSIELFPETRYAKIAQQQLEVLTEETGGDKGGGK
jgi:tetratricopeptide (TPR) repeat protein